MMTCASLDARNRGPTRGCGSRLKATFHKNDYPLERLGTLSNMEGVKVTIRLDRSTEFSTAGLQGCYSLVPSVLLHQVNLAVAAQKTIIPWKRKGRSGAFGQADETAVSVMKILGRCIFETQGSMARSFASNRMAVIFLSITLRPGRVRNRNKNAREH